MRRYCFECELWDTDEAGIVGRCRRTKTETNLHCACDPEPQRCVEEEEYVRVGSNITVIDTDTGYRYYYHTIRDAANRTGAPYCTLCRRLRENNTLRMKGWTIIKEIQY